MKLITLVSFLFLCSYSWAQVSFTAQVNRTEVAIGEPIQLVFKTNTEGDFAPPVLSHFRAQGPQTSSSNSIQIINGNITKTANISYSYRLLAEKVGEYTIGAAKLTVGGQVYQTTPITIKVSKNSSGQSRLPSEDPNLFGRIEISKKSLFLGEHTLVSYKIFSRYRSLENTEADYPMANGIWKEEIKAGKDGWPASQQKVGNTMYNVYTIKKEVLYPQKSGKIEIPAFHMDFVVNRSFFNAGTTVKVKSNSPTLNVKAIPNPPANFSGLVGDFSLESEISSTDLEANEGLDLKLKVKGKGNLKQLDQLAVQLPPDFEQFDPEIKENIKISSSGASGSKSFNYLSIPRSGGSFEIPEVQLVYFDPKHEVFKTLTSDSWTVHVKGEKIASSGGTFSAKDQQQVALLNEGMRHIKNKTTLVSMGHQLYGSTRFWLLLFLPLLVLMLVLFGKKKFQERPRSNQQAKQAGKLALKALQNSKSQLDSGNTNGFHETFLAGLFGYLDHKLQLTTAELNRNSIHKTLQQRGAKEATIEKLIAIKAQCEMDRYTPGVHSANNLQEIYNQGIQIIENLENEITA